MLAARLQKPAIARLKKYDNNALEELTSFKPRVAFLLTAPFDENLETFERVANDMAHMASFALVDETLACAEFYGVYRKVPVIATWRRWARVTWLSSGSVGKR